MQNRSRWQSKKTWRSPHHPSRNTSKIHQHMEQLLLKTGKRTPIQLRLQARCTYNQVKRGEKLSSQDICLWEGTQRKGENTQVTPALERGVRDKDGAPVLGSYMGEMSPLTGSRTRETNRRAVGSLDSTHEECAQAGCPRGWTGRSLR